MPISAWSVCNSPTMPVQVPSEFKDPQDPSDGFFIV